MLAPLAPPRFCLRFAGVVAIFVCEADMGVVPFASFFVSCCCVFAGLGCGWLWLVFMLV